MSFLLSPLLLGALLSILGVAALKPKITEVNKAVVAQKGSSVTLSCLATEVNQRKTLHSWEFNGQERKSSNRVIIPKPHYWTAERKGNFSLNIKNVSENDVGTYTCKVYNLHGAKSLETKENIELSLQEESEEVLNVTSNQTNITLVEGSTTTLHCRVSFSEAFTTYAYWLFNGKILRKPKALRHEVDGVSLGNKVKQVTFRRELKHVTLAQSGIYTCGANSTNGLQTHDIAVSVYRTHGPNLNLEKTKPFVEITNGENVTLSCLGTYPAASFEDAFWLLNDSQIKDNKHFEVNNAFVEEKGNIKRKLLGLTIYNAELEDNGNYSCVLNTSHGLRRKNIKVHVQSRVPERQRNVLKGETMHFKQVLYISLGLFAGVVTAIGIFVKLWYQRRPELPPSIKPCLDDEELIFKYDVFVTYSRQDAEWVNSKLLSLLNRNHVKYCIDKLHFKLGYPILNSITDSVYQSRYVLAVWSGSFAASKFCKQELDFALQRSFRYSDYSVILIGLESINLKKLPKPLRARTFLNYSDSVDREGWEKRLIKHLKGSANNKFAHELGTVV